MNRREPDGVSLRWFVHVGLPLSASLTLHAGVLAALVYTSWHIAAPPSSTVEYHVGITAQAGPTGSGLEWSEETPLSVPSAASSSASSVTHPTLSELARMPTDASPSSPAGGFGMGSMSVSGILGLGGGAGDGGGAGLGAGFGSGQVGQSVGVWNVSVPANSVAYVVDFSGSIIIAVDDLKRELKRSVGSLKPTQSFNVIVFYSVRVAGREQFRTESFGPQLIDGHPAAKRQLFEWIDTKAPSGSTEPLPAIRRAIAMRPEVIFFFSDGVFEDQVVTEIARANRAGKSRIHCMVFDESLLDAAGGATYVTEGARRLQRIAEQNGGKTKIVNVTDLRRR